MAHTVVLHVGVMKSGTSHVQSLASANRDLLLGRGLLLPGERWADQVAGVAEVLERKRVAVAPRPGAWKRLVDELAHFDGTGLVSMEFLGPVGQQRIRTVVDSFPAGSVRVVLTARDLGRQVPAMWQEAVKNGRTFPFADYVESVRTNGEGPGRAFWREQTVAAMCRRWGEVVGMDRVTVVTVPPPGNPSSELWRRFSEAVGVDGAGVADPGTDNASLGAASVEALRRLNERLTDLDFPDYAPVVKHHLAKRVLAAGRADEQPVGFDVPPWLEAASARMRARLAELGVRVVGDLDDLVPVAVPGRDPASLTEAEVSAALLRGLDGVVRRLVAVRGEG